MTPSDPVPSVVVRRKPSQHLLAIVSLVVAVLLGNVLSFTYSDPDPLLTRSGLQLEAPQRGGLPPGLHTIDPNDGFTTQALGVASVTQLLHGQLPLWNHDEGVGEPLAGGMQAASFFPLAWLLLLPNGVLIFHMVLELIAGIGMYLLLRRLRISPWLAVAGGVLFELNGAYAWLANAVVNPIAFLPWLLLGIELARESSRVLRARGWWLVALSIALSLYAGFPEVAYLDALLAVGWALVRLPGVRRKLAYLLSVAVGAVLGVALAAPILVLFVDYLPQSWSGGHSGDLSSAAVPALGLVTLAFPYLLGPIFALAGTDTSGTIAAIWSNVGGYLSLGTAGLAFVGLFGRRSPLALRIFLAAWCVFAVARIYGVPVIGHVFDLIPGVDAVAAYRYLPASVAAAAVVLAAIAAQAVLDGFGSRALRITIGAVLAAGALAVLGLGVRKALSFHGVPHFHLWIAFFAGVALVVLAAIVLALLGWRLATRALVPIVLLEAIGLFAVPQLAATLRPASVDTAPVAFLQKHVGEYRMFGLGVLQPNYGSYYGIASVNENNLPVPKAWADYIGSSLDAQEGPISFDGSFDPVPDDQVTPVSELLRNLGNYEALGVKYVAAQNGAIAGGSAQTAGLTTAYSDAHVTIYELPHPAPYFSTDASCSIRSSERDAAAADCTDAAQLTRRELYFPGWTATIDGKTAHVAKDGLFQRVSVPPGRHTISFAYRPRYLGPAVVLAGVAALVWLLGVLWITAEVRRYGRSPRR